MKPVKAVEGLYVSAMPRPWQLGELERFDLVVSLATPIEHAWGGYDPRLLGEKLVWTPVPEYNAPPLNELAYMVSRVEAVLRRGGRVLVHDRNGCARAVMAVAAILAARGKPYTLAVAEASNSVGCRLDTASQLQAVRGLSYALKAGLKLEDLSRLDDAQAARVEYAVTLGFELTPYGDANVVTMVKGECLEASVEGLASCIVDELAKELDYAVAWIGVTRIHEAELVLRIVAWIPRKAHPQVVRRPARAEIDAIKRFWLMIAKRLGYERATVELKTFEPVNPPPPPL